MHEYMYIYMFTYIYIFIYIYVHMHIFLHIHAYIYIYIYTVGVRARVYVHFCVECGMYEPDVLSTSGVSAVKTLFNMKLHICKHALHRACTCARVCAVFLLALGGEGGWVSTSLYRALFAWRGRSIFDRSRDEGVVLCLLYF